ncbi:MAG TPA: CAP domain-containing protein [Bacteroidales bacterium]|nr:CAP domain-containing protein [Bacteroidales bacterium]
MLYLEKNEMSSLVFPDPGSESSVDSGDDILIDFRSLTRMEGKMSYSPGDKIKPEPEPAPKPAPASEPSGTAMSLNPKEQEMLGLINEARRNAGLRSLQLCNELTAAARFKSRDMADNNYFSHTSPRYGGLTSLLDRFGISFQAAGENIAKNSSDLVSDAHGSLMDSPEHRANILNGSYDYVGVGVAVQNNGVHLYTQLFVGRK